MLKIRWIGQSGYILNDGKTEICIDPYLSDVVNRIANRPRMVKPILLPGELESNIVVCTHNHLDHIDIDAIPFMNKENMVFLAPSDAEEQLKKCGVIDYRAFDEGDTYNTGDFKIQAVFADHSISSIGIVIKHCGTVLYFSGDTLYNDKLEEMKNFNIDIMFVCINGKLGNMNVKEAVKLAEIIAPKTAVPNHYGMFESNTENPEKFNYSNRFIMEYGREYEVKGGCLI